MGNDEARFKDVLGKKTSILKFTVLQKKPSKRSVPRKKSVERKKA